MDLDEVTGTKLKQARAEATRATLLAAARTMFAELGYHASGISEIVSAAAVTRGGLYYHFAEKRDLFEAVFRQLLQEKFAQIVDAVEDIADDRWQHFVMALRHKLQMIVSDPEIQRITLIDGPAVLGWRKWTQIQEDVSGKATASELAAMMDLGIIRRLDPASTAHLILTSLNEASLMIAHAPKPEQALHDAGDAMFALLEGLRCRPEISA